MSNKPAQRRASPKNRLRSQQVRSFRSLIYHHYKKCRRDFPWRHTSSPYRILVSEIMLQQTQAARVVEKYASFITTFPNIKKLASAPIRKVLQAWQGLGYNRRAIALRCIAQIVILSHQGRLPRNYDALLRLPGVGPATAAAIMAFAFNKTSVYLETNVRTVFIHHFFRTKKSVKDSEILPLIEQTMDARDPKKWYTALLDYGAQLKKQRPNPSRRSARFATQSRFEGSNRQLRGKIIQTLITKENQTPAQLARLLRTDKAMVLKNLEQMKKEGLIKKHALRFSIL